jgi:RecJ-like exonuclease
MMKCKNCDGEGWTAEHDPSDTSHEHMQEGQCSSCPVQMGCDTCQGTGMVEDFDELGAILDKAK